MAFDFCKATLTTPALSSHGWNRLISFKDMNWGQLWSLLTKYAGPALIAAIEEVLLLLPLNATWKEALQLIIDKLSGLLGTPISV